MKTSKKEKKKRNTIIAILAFVLLGGGVVGGIMKTGDSQAKAEVFEVKEMEKSIQTVADTAEKSLEASKAEEEKKKAEKEKETAKEESDNQKVAESNAGNANSASSVSSESSSSGNSSNSSTTNSKSSTKDTTKSSNNSNDSSKPTKPAHTHSWQPVYDTWTEYEYEYVEYITCNQCDFKTYDGQSAIKAHIKQNAVSNGCGGWSIYEEYIEKPYEVTDVVGYKCSCGVSK